MEQSREQRITFTLHHLVAELDDYADAVLRADFGLTYRQFLFLAVLLHGPALDVTHLAEALGVSKAAVSKRLPFFAEKGLIRTSGDPDNARRVLVALTGAGRDRVQEAATALEREFLRLFPAEEGAELERLHDGLRRMLEVVRTRRRL